jgi:hypothetical protein
MSSHPHQSPAVRREDAPSTDAQFAHYCERCGERMEERQCKIICTNCGMMRDCSDP